MNKSHKKLKLFIQTNIREGLIVLDINKNKEINNHGLLELLLFIFNSDFYDVTGRCEFCTLYLDSFCLYCS